MASKKYLQIKTKYGQFEILLQSNQPERGYTVTVSKLKGVVTHGNTMIEAKKMAQEAVELHCESLLSDGLAEVRVLTRNKALA